MANTAQPDHPQAGRRFLARYGATILRGGLAPIPTALYIFQAELHLSPQEIWFIGYLLAHKWDEDLPYPSLVKMARRTGYSQQQLHRIKNSLVAKGLLEIIPRHSGNGGQDTNAYDLGQLFERMEQLIHQYGPHGERLPDGALEEARSDVRPPSNVGVRPPLTSVLDPPSTPVLDPPLTPVLDEEESYNEEPDQVEPPPGGRRETHIPSRREQPSVVVVAVASDQIQTDARLLNQQLGVDPETALEYARLVQKHGRQKGYVAELLTHALTDPDVRDPIKVVLANIKANVRRGGPGTPKRGKGSGKLSAQPARPTRPAQPEFMLAPAQPSAPAPLPPDDPTLPGIWQKALASLQMAVSAEDRERVLPYVRLVELDRTVGQALLIVNNEAQRRAVLGGLVEPLRACLRVAAGLSQPVQIFAIVGGPQQALTTLAAYRAAAPQPAQDGSGAVPSPAPSSTSTTQSEVAL